VFNPFDVIAEIIMDKFLVTLRAPIYRVFKDESLEHVASYALSCGSLNIHRGSFSSFLLVLFFQLPLCDASTISHHATSFVVSKDIWNDVSSLTLSATKYRVDLDKSCNGVLIKEEKKDTQNGIKRDVIERVCRVCIKTCTRIKHTRECKEYTLF